MWGARLSRSAGDSQSCVLVSELDAPPSLPVEVAFGVANKAHTLWLVEKATEMGVARLSPVEFARSRSVADAARPATFWKKAGRRAVSAMKQSGGAWLPELEKVRDLQEFLTQSGREGTSSDPTPAVAAVRILLDQSAEPLGRRVSEWNGDCLLYTSDAADDSSVV